MLTIASLGHVALRVKDVERSVDFYGNKLGFKEMMRLNHDDGRLWLVYFRLTDDQFLEIFPDGEGDRTPGWNQVSINHFCITVPDIDQCIAELAEAGIPLTTEKVMMGDRNWQAWIEDPDGHRIELMQMMPDSLQAEAIARLAAVK